MAVPKDIKEKVARLRKEIDRHRRLYHEKDEPEISDEAYDSLMALLISYETKYPELKSARSPSERIGGEPLKEFSKVKINEAEYEFALWLKPLLSLLNIPLILCLSI